MATWQGTTIFTSSSKYNFWDLNRENNNIQYLIDALVLLGYPVSYSLTSNYTRASLPTVSAINATRQAIVKLIQGFYAVSAPAIAVDTTRLQLFDYNNANAIEQNTQALYEMFNKLSGYLQYCGQANGGLSCGQDNTYL